LKADEQKDLAVKSLLSGRDVVAILPTGFGKSLIFQLFAIAKSIEATRANTSPGSVLVICPLDSIVKDQLTEAESYGLSHVQKCLNKSKMPSAKAVIRKAFRESLKRTRNIHAIVINESHTVWKHGQEKGKQ
jgi:ATP-dependent DNA helicase RecQ